MSQYLGEKEAPLASTKKDSKSSVQDYSFAWIKSLVDILIPARLLQLKMDRSVTLSTRK